jgi:type I restriction enzyme M protein
MDHNTHNAIISFIWGIADDVLRDVYVRGKYRDVILPMTVLRRLDCLLEPTKDEVLKRHAWLDEQKIFEQTAALTKASGYPFYNTSSYTLKRLLDEPNQVEANFRNYLNGFSPNVQQIIEKFKFKTQIETLVEADRLYGLIEKLVSSKINLSPEPVLNSDGTVIYEGLSNLGMGYVFEELIRKFNEENNEEAGEHFTPRDIIKLMVNLIFLPVRDQIQSTTYLIYDCACGSGGMLTEAEAFMQDLAKKTKKKVKIQLYGQEVNPETFAICQADMLIQERDPDKIKYGSTLANDAFPGMEFDFMLANPPYGKSWKLDKESLEEGKGKNRAVTDPRFLVEHSGDFGAEKLELLPRVSDGQLLFLVNKLSKMKQKTKLGSRIAIVHNGSALFTGDAGQGESNVRRWILENDWLECIIGLPLDMFYNTGIATYIWVLSNRKPEHRRGKVQLIDGTDWYSKRRKNLGKKNCDLTEADIQRITESFLDFEETAQSKIFDNEDFGYHKIVVERPLRLAFQVTVERVERFNLAAAVGLRPIVDLLQSQFGEKLHLDWNQVHDRLEKALKKQEIKLKATDWKAIRDGFTERDEAAEPVVLKKTKDGVLYEPDAELRDTENVPLKEEIGDYVAREVWPHVPDAWVDEEKTQRGMRFRLRSIFINLSRYGVWSRLRRIFWR